MSQRGRDAVSDKAASRAAAYALAVLTFINLFNYLDRWVLSSVLEAIKRDLHFSDTQLGSLATGFIIVYMLTSPVFGTLGDRKRRPPLIALGVAIWSVATAAAGFAQGFASLFTARATVGVGEAAYGTIAPALLSDHFPLEKRGRVFAVFFAAIPVGSAAGYMVGGLVDKHFGWRAAFWVAGAPGLLLALLVMFVREVPRGLHDQRGEGRGESGEEMSSSALPSPASPLQSYLRLFHNRQYLLTCIGYAMWTFALGGLGVWTPAFMERVRGMSREDATVTFGAIVLVTGFVGTFAGGWLSDYLLKFTKESYLWLCGITSILAAPLTLIAFTHPNKSVWLPAMVAAEVLVFASTGPVNSAIVNLVSPGERATALALSILLMHVLGDVPSPPLIGYLSDISSLQRAFLIVPVAILAGGVIWSYAAWRGARVAA
ncbi:MAG TPA: MFS transporter [Thermoanaerobaculia bacterium]|nr:MFS transporter [Thermoanaerobaculia bacterium]